MSEIFTELYEKNDRNIQQCLIELKTLPNYKQLKKDFKKWFEFQQKPKFSIIQGRYIVEFG